MKQTYELRLDETRVTRRWPGNVPLGAERWVYISIERKSPPYTFIEDDADSGSFGWKAAPDLQHALRQCVGYKSEQRRLGAWFGRPWPHEHWQVKFDGDADRCPGCAVCQSTR